MSGECPNLSEVRPLDRLPAGDRARIVAAFSDHLQVVSRMAGEPVRESRAVPSLPPENGGGGRANGIHWRTVAPAGKQAAGGFYSLPVRERKQKRPNALRRFFARLMTTNKGTR